MIAREAVLHYQKQCMTMHVCVVLPQPCAQKHARARPCHACAVPSMPVHIARRQRLSGSISDWRAYKVVRVKFLFSPYGKTVCPSGLRGWTQVPLARAAWVQIPQLSWTFPAVDDIEAMPRTPMNAKQVVSKICGPAMPIPWNSRQFARVV